MSASVDKVTVNGHSIESYLSHCIPEDYRDELETFLNKYITKHAAALKQELKQSLEAHKIVISEAGITDPQGETVIVKKEAVPMEAIEAVFQDKGDNRE